MSNVLKRMKNKFSDLCDFYFSELWVILFIIVKCFLPTRYIKKKFSKDGNILELIIVFIEFFCVTFIFWDLVNFVFDIHSELVWDLRDFFEPDSDAIQWC